MLTVNEIRDDEPYSPSTNAGKPAYNRLPWLMNEIKFLDSVPIPLLEEILYTFMLVQV